MDVKGEETPGTDEVLRRKSVAFALDKEELDMDEMAEYRFANQSSKKQL